MGYNINLTLPINIADVSHYLEHEDYYIKPLDQVVLINHPHFLNEIYTLLSDNRTLHYIPEKRITGLDEAERWLGTTLLNIHCGRNQTHLIINGNTGNLVGLIDIIPPTVTKEHYQLEAYPYFLEFYLKSSATGRSLMSSLLPLLVAKLRKKGVTPLAAVVNRQNIPAQKVLSRSGFEFDQCFDMHQDLYSLSA